MKTKSILITLVSSMLAFGAVAQSVENDDMYFNSKDRAKLNAQRATEQEAYASNRSYDNNARSQRYQNDDTNVNPTDSYSARNVNPEYVSRNNSQSAQTDNQDYFVSGYQYSPSNTAYNTASNYNNWNNGFNNWYGSSWYNSSWYGPSMYSMNSPYYYGYSRWNDPLYPYGYG